MIKASPDAPDVPDAKPKLAAIAAAVAGVAAIGAAAYVVYEKRATPRPGYQVVEHDGDIEVRDYPALLVAETWATGPRDKALNQGFETLAAYIFAKRRGAGDDGARVAMTSPVLSDRDAEVVDQQAPRRGWRTRFIMPAPYTRATLPPPGDGIEIDGIPARRVAVIRFSGYATDARLSEHKDRLRAWIVARAMTAIGEAEYAYYDSPMIPGPLRRNEVLLPITRTIA